MTHEPPTRPRKRRRRRSPTQGWGTQEPAAPDEPPRVPDLEVDVAPDLVDRGPDDKRDRDPICSLAEDQR